LGKADLRGEYLGRVIGNGPAPLDGAVAVVTHLAPVDGLHTAPEWVLSQTFPASRARPLVTVLDGHPHTLAFLAGINQVPAAHLGVTRFGQSGALNDVYRHHGLDTDSIVRAGLELADLHPAAGNPGVPGRSPRDATTAVHVPAGSLQHVA
jgi:pyruvate dehydrogenase complex dehydrogenase (E1) component